MDIMSRKDKEMTWKKRNTNLTCFSSNWSPPNAATQGLIPPVPRAIRDRPVIDKILQIGENFSTIKRLGGRAGEVLGAELLTP